MAATVSAEQYAALTAQLESLRQQLASVTVVQPANATRSTEQATPAQHPENRKNSAAQSTQIHQAAISKPLEEPWQRQPRNPRGAFSPGYGVRGTEVDDGPASDLVSEAGTVHRVYPAPTEQSPPLNKDDGWPVPAENSSEAPTCQVKGKAPQPPSPNGFHPPPEQAASSYGVFTPPETPQHPATEQIPSPPSGGGEAYISWEPVVYKDHKHNEADPNAAEGLTDCLAGMREKREAARAAGGGVNGFDRPRDQGYRPRSSKGEGDCHCNDSGQHNPSCPVHGYGYGGRPCMRCHEEDHAARDCPMRNRDRGRDNDGFGGGFGGGGGGRGCFNCGQEGHMSRDCPEPRKGGGGGGGCYNCGQDGHMSRDCPEPKKGSGGGGFGGAGFGGATPGACHKGGEEGHWSRECPQGGGGGSGCYNCGQEGHLSRDCIEPTKGGGGGGGVTCYNCGQEGHMSRDCLKPKGQNCYNCGQEGHTSRDCTEPRKENGGRPPRAQDSGWGSSNGAGASSSFDSSSGDDGWSNSSGSQPVQVVNNSGIDWDSSSSSTVKPAASTDEWDTSSTPAQPSNNPSPSANGPLANGHDEQQSQPSDSGDAPPPSPQRNQHYIDPGRLRMMGRGGAFTNGGPRQNGTRPPRPYEQGRPVPVRQDNGWASRSQAAAPESAPPAREPTPPPADNEFGGW